MTYCPFQDEECIEMKLDCKNCCWAEENLDFDYEDEEIEINNYDPFNDIGDTVTFINYIDEHNNDYIPEE